jgi:hypothetical protein
MPGTSAARIGIDLPQVARGGGAVDVADGAAVGIVDGVSVRLCGYMWRSDVVEVLGGSGESHDVHRFIHHSSSIKLTRALPPIPQFQLQ